MNKIIFRKSLKIILIGIFFYFTSVNLSAAVRAVAVVNFSNHTGSTGLQYLSTALPESISATLPQAQGIRVVERNQLRRLVKEIELGQTGLFDEKTVIRAGRITQADVLLLGSFSGNPEMIVVSLKAVDVKTANVIDGRVVKAPLATLFDVANQAALSMTAVISGANVGRISVSSTPDGADIYLDGMLIGKAPIVEAKTTAGIHRLKAVKSGYIDAETEITVEKDGREKWTPYLAESRLRNRTEMGLGIHYFYPVNDKLDPAPFYSIFVGQSFQRLNFAGEFGYARIKHDQPIDTPFGPISQGRFYRLYILHIHVTYAPVELGPYVTPYFGVFGGWGYLTDYRKNTTASEDTEKIGEQSIWSIGPKVGINLAPFSKVSLFIEAKFLYTPNKVDRNVYVSRGVLGGFDEKHTKYYFNAFTIGGGIKFYFN